MLWFAVMCVTAGYARLGETEKELITRFGEPLSRGQHSMFAQGKSWKLGPRLTFKQDLWEIHCDLVDERVAHIHYFKRGDWTEEQVQTVLAYNTQGIAWTEQESRFPKSVRTWKRKDGATAEWRHGAGLDMTVPAYNRAREVIEAKAKAEVSRKPKI